MVRSELIERMVADHPELDTEVVGDAVIRFFEEITEHLVKRGRVEVRGFGAFSVRVRDRQIVLNPRTGDKIAKPESPGAYFRPGKDLADLLRNNLR